MARYHMKEDGTPGICNAQPGNCPLGGNENHVEADTIGEAQKQFDDRNEVRARRVITDDNILERTEALKEYKEGQFEEYLCDVYRYSMGYDFDEVSDGDIIEEAERQGTENPVF